MKNYQEVIVASMAHMHAYACFAAAGCAHMHLAHPENPFWVQMYAQWMHNAILMARLQNQAAASS